MGGMAVKIIPEDGQIVEVDTNADGRLDVVGDADTELERECARVDITGSVIDGTKADFAPQLDGVDGEEEFRIDECLADELMGMMREMAAESLIEEEAEPVDEAVARGDDDMEAVISAVVPEVTVPAELSLDLEVAGLGFLGGCNREADGKEKRDQRKAEFVRRCGDELFDWVH